MAKIFVSKPIALDLTRLESQPKRIDLEFKGVSHGGASFEARVFINNKDADANTEYSDDSYAGSFFVFGHGGCFGDKGHCDVPVTTNMYDRRQEHPLVPASKRIEVTQAVRNALLGSKSSKPRKTFTVTVVPIVTSATDKCDVDNPLRFKELTAITYD